MFRIKEREKNEGEKEKECTVSDVVLEHSRASYL